MDKTISVFIISSLVMLGWAVGAFILYGVQYYFAQKGSICKNCGGVGVSYWTKSLGKKSRSYPYKEKEESVYHEEGIICPKCNGVGRTY